MNAVINKITSITISQQIGNKTVYLTIQNPTNVEYQSDSISAFDSYGRLVSQRHLRWTDLFTEGTRFSIEGEYEDLDTHQIYYATYDLKQEEESQC